MTAPIPDPEPQRRPGLPPRPTVDAHAAMAGSRSGPTVVGDKAKVVGRLDVGRGNVYFGDVYQGGKPGKVHWPVRVGLLPAVADGYQDRGIELPPADNRTVTVVSTGLGGTGKTQLATHYAHEQWAAGHLDLLAWVPGKDRGSILAGYTTTANAIGLTTTDNLEQNAATLLAHLSRLSDLRWLLVVDDLARPDDLQQLWPQGSGGTVLITTRYDTPAWTQYGRIRIPIDVFTPLQATQYLNRKLTVPREPSDIAGLAEDLGHLPLALAQAVAYLADRGLPISAYRQRLAAATTSLGRLLPPDTVTDDYPTPVATTWQISIQTANEQPPPALAGHLLNLLSVLDPNGTPPQLLDGSPVVLAYLNWQLGRAAPAAVPSTRRLWPRLSARTPASSVDVEDIADAIAHLRRFSLATTTDEEVTQTGPIRIVLPAGWVRVHALLQRVTWDAVPSEQRAALAGTAADALTGSWPDQDYRPECLPLATAYRTAASTLITRAGPLLWHPSGGHAIHWRLGASLRDAGLYLQNVTHWEYTHHTAERQLGASHHATLRSKNNLASAYQEAGRLLDAIPLFEATLRERERILGVMHPETLGGRNNLAFSYRQAGRLDEAIAVFETNCQNTDSLLGRTHPDTLVARNNLALAYQEDGRVREAITLFETILRDRAEVLGYAHPQTLITRINLGATYGMGGRTPEAIALLEATVREIESTLGPIHPHTLSGRCSLAKVYQDAGRLDDAIALLEPTLLAGRATLGLSHPETLVTQITLAKAYGDAGRTGEAIALFEAAIGDSERTMGPDNPIARTAQAFLIDPQATSRSPGRHPGRV